MTTQSARAMCYQALAHGSRSFWLASLLLPSNYRDDVAALYAWCRYCDDAIDQVPVSEQPAALTLLENELGRIYDDDVPDQLLLSALHELVHTHNIPLEYPRELLQGFAMDVNGTQYDTMEDLFLYCYRVAGTVGLMMCHIFGTTNYQALRSATHMGMAMQLTNICRDVLEDWDLGRLYIPRDLLRESGAETLSNHLSRPLPSNARIPLQVAVRKLLQQAELLYRSGDAGISMLPWRCGLTTRAARLIYSSIGRQLEHRDCDIFKGRVIVPLPVQIGLWTRAVGTTLLHFPVSKARRNQLKKTNVTLRFPDDFLPIQTPPITTHNRFPEPESA